VNTASKSFGHQPRKRFGQHFLRDHSIIDAIVASANPRADDIFVEIGPGFGALTVPLLKRLDNLHVVELDRDIIPRLSGLPGAEGKLTVHQADALKFDFASIEDKRQMRIIGNLPYNISTPLLFHLLKFRERIRDMHFMLQREVVLRLAAKPNCKEYGRLSIIAQYHCQIDPLLDVPPSAFDPPPKVDSAVVRLQPHAQVPVAVGDLHSFETLLRCAFSQRRKTLRNNLKAILSAEQISTCEIDPGARAETLDLGQFAALSRQLNNLTHKSQAEKL
jgi:16S rRNA (adenine1518-N6/adenine1519-N6)-dimethyltransferase